MDKNMKVVILCGGYGTRIRDVADDIPKPMIPVGGLPILWHIMKYYSHWGYNDFVLCLGYKGHTIKEFFLKYEALTRDFTISLSEKADIQYHSRHDEQKWKVTLAQTGDASMTGARVKRIQRYVEGDENFLLTYGDGLGDIDIDKLVAYHRSHGKILTMSGVRPPGRFGEVMMDTRGMVTEFNEKPQATAGIISGGFFVCRWEIFKYFNDRENLVFERDPIEMLVRDKQMMVYEHDGFWQPMDTYRDYQMLNELWEKGIAPWKLWK